MEYFSKNKNQPFVALSKRFDTLENPNWYFPMHNHTVLEITFIYEGINHYHYRNQLYCLTKGDIAIKNANQFHSEQADSSQRLVEVCIQIDDFQLAHQNRNTLFDDDQCVLQSREYYDVLKSLFELIENNENEGLNCQALNTIILILLQIQKKGYIQSPIHQAKKETVLEVKNYIEQNFTYPITLTNLAERFYVSPFYLSRNFKKTTGYNINEYVNSLRLGKAQMLLLTQLDLSVSTISQQCGFNDSHYFHLLFKKATGYSPNEFRSVYKIKNMELDHDIK